MTTRALYTWGLAIGAHVALAWALPRPTAMVAGARPTAPPTEISVDVAEVPTETEHGDRGEATAVAASAGRSVRSSQDGTTGTTVVSDLPTGPVETAPTGSQTAPAFGGLLVVPGDRSTIGLAGPSSYRTESALTAPVASGLTAKQRFDAALNAPLQDRDRELGMLQEGPAIVALEDATRASSGPLEGRAVLALTFDSSGVVTGARVESSSSDRATWEDIAKKAAAALGQKHVRVPAGAKGLELRIEVQSKVALPSGAHSPISGVGLTGDGQGNMGLGGHFDVSDIGSKPQRVVGARTVGSSTW